MTETLPIRPNKTTHQTLVRAARTLAHAIGHSSGGNEIDRMITIHGLDNACEFLLRIIGDHLELESKTGKSWDFVDLSSLAGQTDKALHDHYNYRLPHLADLKMLRQVRNLVQHGAIDPQGDIQRFATIVQRFYSRLLQDVFDLEGGEVATSALIDNVVVKQHLKSAEDLLSEGRYLEAVIDSRNAFENAYYRKLLFSDVTLSLLPAILEAKENNNSYSWSMVTIKNELEFTRLGINTEETRRFLEYVDYIPFEHRCDGYARVLNRDWSKDDADFCYSYASSIVLQWQLNERSSIDTVDHDFSKYRHIQKIADINMSNIYEGGCLYIDKNTERQFWYLDKERKELLEKLEIGNEYKYETERYENEILKHKSQSTILLKGIYSELTTNVPERWKVIIWYDRLNQ
jgi:hypothetical protein